MNLLIETGLLLLLVGLSATYSGSETGFYSLSSVQVDIDARSGSRRAVLMRWLLRNESALLITILIGNNLALELATHVAESMTVQLTGSNDPATVALVVTAALTPLVFLFGEALPKDVFRQRPHGTTALVVPIIALSRVIFWPLERALRLFTLALERLLGLGAEVTAPVGGRAAVLGFIAEGRRHGVLSERAEALAANALRLRAIPVSESMVPWEEVAFLDRGTPREELFSRVRESRFSRLPVLEIQEGLLQIEGYVHQMEILHRWHAMGEEGELPEVLEQIRPLPRLARDVPVDRALNTFAASGRRIALVVTEDVAGESGPLPPEAILGLVSVNDLLERISHEVVR
ncbi:CNNM domain-containing protein [Planctomycetota bacterium]|jgi:putative hemolysin|nr:CNNM domain-containing protein [Planctomycetota bacterium]